MMTELKPCPFCGGKARIVENGEPETSKYYFVDVLCTNMVCRGCSSCLESRTKKQAIAAWNIRAESHSTEKADFDYSAEV